MLYKIKKNNFVRLCFDSIANAKKAGLKGTFLEIKPKKPISFKKLASIDKESRKLLIDACRRLKKNNVKCYILPLFVKNIDFWPEVQDEDDTFGVGFNLDKETFDIYDEFGEYGLRYYLKVCGYKLVMEWD